MVVELAETIVRVSVERAHNESQLVFADLRTEEIAIVGCLIERASDVVPASAVITVDVQDPVGNCKRVLRSACVGLSTKYELKKSGTYSSPLRIISHAF